MTVSAKGRYALRVMAELAKSEGYRSLKDIAAEQDIPHKYAENIMTSLVKAGFIEATRGKNGGYRLARSPEEYTVAEILAQTESSMTAAACTGADCCPRACSCTTLPIWKGLDDTVNEYLSRYTLADLSR